MAVKEVKIRIGKGLRGSFGLGMSTANRSVTLGGC